MNNDKKFDEILKFIIANPAKAKELYPELVQGLEERILDWPPEVMANIIQNEPNLFLKRREEADLLIGLRREKYIKERIIFLFNLITIDYADEVEFYARESVRDEILEELKYWVELSKKPLKTPKNEFPFYCKVGVLFAQGFIRMVGFDCYYQDVKFDNVKRLSEHVQKNVLKTDKNVRQYINDTLRGGSKSFFKSKGMAKKILAYCEHVGVVPVKSFIDKIEKMNSY